ncbi:hypothetical protein Hanom_Chr16g01449491 [Helianthus anomalus]
MLILTLKRSSEFDNGSRRNYGALTHGIELVGPGPKPKTHKPKPTHNIIDLYLTRSYKIMLKSLQNLSKRSTQLIEIFFRWK